MEGGSRPRSGSGEADRPDEARSPGLGWRDEDALAYLEAVEGLDGAAHVERLLQLLRPGARVLELGSGPGIDLALLAEHFDVTGSDPSPAFRRLARRRLGREGPDILDLDARRLDTMGDRRFDAIVSNKVLHLLSPADQVASARSQAAHLEPDGVVLHVVWHDTTTCSTGHPGTDHHGLDRERLVRPWTAFDVVEMQPLSELGHEDTLRLIARLRATRT